MANEDEEVIIDNRIEVLVDALANSNVDVDGIEPQSDIEVLLLRAIRVLRNLQFTSSADTAAFVEELAKKANKTDIKDPVWGVITGQITNQTDLNDALNALQEAITALNTAMSNKADKTDITDPAWGQIEGSLANQTDLTNALSGKASISELAAVDTRTRNLESSVADKASKTEVNAKANTTDVNAALDLKADTSWTNKMLATKASTDALNAGLATKANTSDVETALAAKADKTALDAKANTSDVETALAAKADKTALDAKASKSEVNSKASVKKWDNVKIPASGWSASAPYTQTVTVTGMLAAYTPFVDVQFTNNTATPTERAYYNCVDKITAGANSITLVCVDEKPAGTFYINLKEVS